MSDKLVLINRRYELTQLNTNLPACIYLTPLAPMPHFTPQAKSPKPESLLYIAAFARLYSPAPDNEQTARSMASLCRRQTKC